MSVKELLAEHRTRIAEKWIEAVNGTYPFGTIGFLRTQSNPFVNPVGQRNREAAQAMLQSLIDEEPDQEALTAALEEFVKVRAVQSFSPEQAVGIVYALKPIVYEILGARLEEEAKTKGLDDIKWFERHVDALALTAFGIYSRCRDTMAEMRIDEFKRRHSQIIRQAERVLNEKFPEHKLK